MKSRDKIRKEAKRVYKEQSKRVPKKHRMPFADFFKNYIKTKTSEPKQDNEEDFDFDNLVNMNEVGE